MRKRLQMCTRTRYLRAPSHVHANVCVGVPGHSPAHVHWHSALGSHGVRICVRVRYIAGTAPHTTRTAISQASSSYTFHENPPLCVFARPLFFSHPSHPQNKLQ